MHAFLIKENTILQEKGNTFDQDFIETKKSLLARLNESLKGLKQINEEPPVEGIKRRELIKAAQNKMMKILLLDRENEQLMLKNDFKEKQDLTSMPVLKFLRGASQSAG